MNWASIAVSACMLCIQGTIGAQPIEGSKAASSMDPCQVQCGHWTVLRCCEILGVPAEIENIIELMPYDERGHNLLTLRNALKEAGFEVQARRSTIEQLLAGVFPVIAHLQPEHYVTLIGGDERYVILFDGRGRRQKWLVRELKERWTGKVLVVSRVPSDKRIKTGDLGDMRPHIESQTLLLDNGDIRDSGKPVTYTFRCGNIGSSELVIERVMTTCGCLQAEYPDRPISPSDEGSIVLKYDLTGIGGAFSKEAFVLTNDPDHAVVRLTASGIVDRTVIVSPKSLYLGKVVASVEYSATCSLTHTGDEPLRLEAIECHGTGVLVRCFILDDLVARTPGIVRRPNTSHMKLRIRYGDSLRGMITSDVDFLTNIAGHRRVTLPIRATVVGAEKQVPISEGQ